MDGLDIDSKFRLAILAAKRAKQLVKGAKKKIDMEAENPLTIAIEEINEGKINFHILEEDEMLQKQNPFLTPSPKDDADEISDEELLEGLKDMMAPEEEDEEEGEEEEEEAEDEEDEGKAADKEDEEEQDEEEEE